MSAGSPGKSTPRLGPRPRPRPDPEDAGGSAWAPAVVAVDTGGTFTDLLLFRDGRLTPLKVPSTPRDPSEAILEGIERLLGPAGARPPFLLVHGSTVATNAVLERRGARVFLVTNRGFEDVVEIGRQDRPQLYALVGHRDPPLVARDDRIGISGRRGPGGEEEEALDPAELGRLAFRLSEAESVAVCLLHSYADPGHEEAVAAALAPLGRPLSISSRILPEFREYERTSTTVVNAYVAPLMARYLERLAEASGAGAVRVMGSSGGALPLARAVKEPVRTVLSGPAGGVAGCLARAPEAGTDRLLTFDMGGTSTDVALVPGRLLQTREGRIGGLPVAIPLLDIHTVGAGGGSIARVDPGGALRVGPESAGADPGPVCYGRGGDRVTVTDAHVWLGRLPADAFLGGLRSLEREAVAGPLEALARDMGCDPDRAAEGVLEVADAAMERALRVISVERGVDPADYRIMAFGGAAGLHAAELAERLGARGVLVPPDPGLASAWGMLAAAVVRDRTRTVLLESDAPEAGALARELLDEMAREAARELLDEGFPPAAVTVRREVDARYRGQSWELTVPAEGWPQAFHEAHEARYGYRKAGSPVEAVTLRVRAEAPGLAPPSGSPPSESRRSGPQRAPLRWRGRSLDARRLARAEIPDGGMPGPAVILDYSATVWVPPGWEAHPAAGGLLRLDRSDGRER